MGARSVMVFCGEEDTQQQPDSFRCCPLGVQFYSQREIEPYKIMEMDLQFPGEDSQALATRCCGVVVQSAFVKARDMYRVWLMFTDLPTDVQKRLKCVSKKAGTQCPHCENY
ncbi:MAG: hypothetical protein FJ221_12205 [Lentisphaerae bacterium]|nr:hypothetical protein [Lentisphaerota bacterium]